MDAWSLILIIILYFGFLVGIGFLTTKSSSNTNFFTGGKSQKWYLVSFGMIGASLSGVTFISVPGWVLTQGMGYLQMVLGYLIGYAAIAHILLPVYYSRGNVSIYGFLEESFGVTGRKTGAAFFLLSKLVGAGFRLFLVAGVLDLFLFDTLGVPFWITVVITLGLILLYTYRGGIQTLVITDTFQTLAMLTAVIVAIFVMGSTMELDFGGIISSISESPMSKVWNWEPNSAQFFPKQFISGAFIALVMTGLDQDMMQKNLTIANIKESQRNFHWQMLSYVVVNIIFLGLGVIMYQYAEFKGLSLGAVDLDSSLRILAEESGLNMSKLFPNDKFRSDFLFPLLALKYGGVLLGSVFFLGLIAAAYSSADSALTAMTTSFCVDFLPQKELVTKRTRMFVHIGMTLAMLVCILLFNLDKSGTIIDKIFKAAGYTYGPLLGMFAFGLMLHKKRTIWKSAVPFICCVSPILVYIFALQYKKIEFLKNYEFGYELLLINGLLTFILLFVFSKPKSYDL